MEYVIGKKSNPQAVDALIKALQVLEIKNGILYIGYPILTTADERLEIDALLTSIDYGVIIFDFANGNMTSNVNYWNERRDFQNRLYLAVTSQLMKNPSLCKGRKFEIPVEVITFVPSKASVPAEAGLIVADPDSLAATLRESGNEMSDSYLKALNAQFQRVSTIKPAKKRLSVSLENSRGAILKQIEKEIANLDRWQMGAAIESPDGPQRIRGLAGSGKTIVLALKAAYFHAANPEWTVALTFHTRSLYGQFIDLVRRFSFEHSGDEPDWNKLKILHSWGSARSPGVYYEIANHYGVFPKDYNYARNTYGMNHAFEGICNELFQEVQKDPRPPLYDAILIDEAQDLPDSFFKLVYQVVSDPKRIIWAYDELQNLGDYFMKPPKDLFGTDEKGQPFVPALHNVPGQPRQDIILPVCYRNTPWALTIAHALGFGIYRDEGLVQFFEDSFLWDAIGYEVIDGSFEPGQHVSVRRKPESTPDFFRKLIRDPADAVMCMVFDNEQLQAEWVAENIKKNLNEDELEASDILIVFSDPLNVQTKAAPLIEELSKRGIDAHVAGVTTSRDQLFIDNSIAISGIYRAKGNEAPMVYVLNSDYCYEGFELIRKRNTLFTAITRSRAWVRICGCGPAMVALKKEFDKVVENEYQLKFTVPTEQELANMRRIHRDMTPEEKRLAENIITLTDALERGDFTLDILPQDVRRRLMKLLDDKFEVGKK